MRFNSHFQAQRLMDTLQANTQQYFTANEIARGGDYEVRGSVDKEIKRYVKTGAYEIPNTEHLQDDNLLDSNMLGVAGFEKLRKQAEKYAEENKQRTSKLQRANYLVDPKQILSGIH